MRYPDDFLDKAIYGDCLDILPLIPDRSIDAIITDLPYGTTESPWDEIIPFGPMWDGAKRVLKKTGAFVTTANQPFTSKLIVSNLDWFRYSWVWEKPQGVDPFLTKHRPLNNVEDITVFSENGHKYNPQLNRGKPYVMERDRKPGRLFHTSQTPAKTTVTRNAGFRYPTRIIHFLQERGLHPNQKSVSLYEYLIMTYTDPGDVVLDICAGSGTTGVAAYKTGRHFIMIEKDPAYFETMQRRLVKELRQMRLDLD